MNDEVRVKELLNNGKKVIVNTKGKSMRPLLWQGKTQVLIVPVKEPLKKGDIPLVYLKEGLYRLHRIVRIDKTGIYTRGDNTIQLEKVNEEQILGVVKEIYKGDKTLSADDRIYRIYVSIMLNTAFLRLPVYRVRTAVSGITAKIRKTKK